MRILLTGAAGQLGKDLLPLLQDRGEVVAVTRADCDLNAPEAVRKLVSEIRPSVIVNPAAYTAVNEAEANVSLAYATNGTAPGILAEEARKAGAMFLHYSTDYVFDGKKQGAYTEKDETLPLNVYGASKLAGERAVVAAGGRFLVLRTSWVYSANGNNFLLTVRRLAREREELKIVDDQFGSPTSTMQIARASAELVSSYAGSEEGSFPSGVYHMTAGGVVSWCEFARAIVSALGKSEVFEGSGTARQAIKLKRILAIRSSEYQTAALRPLNSELCNDLFEHTFGFRLGTWDLGLEEIVQEIRRRELPSC